MNEIIEPDWSDWQNIIVNPTDNSGWEEWQQWRATIELAQGSNHLLRQNADGSFFVVQQPKPHQPTEPHVVTDLDPELT